MEVEVAQWAAEAVHLEEEAEEGDKWPDKIQPDKKKRAFLSKGPQKCSIIYRVRTPSEVLISLRTTYLPSLF